MATQNPAVWTNPVSSRLEAGGDGVIPSRISTTQRLALSLGTNDAGVTCTDTTLGLLCTWSGTAWNIAGGSGDSALIDVRAYGAKGDGTTNDTQAVINAVAAAVASGCRGIIFPSNYNFLLNSRTGSGTADAITIPNSFLIVVEGTITGSIGSAANFYCQGDVTLDGRNRGRLNIGQGFEYRWFQFTVGTVIIRGFADIAGPNNVSTACIFSCPAPASGTLNSLTIEDCVVSGNIKYLYLREQTLGQTHQILSTRIRNIRMKNIYHGSGVVLNDVAGLDRDIQFSGIQINGVYGSVGDGTFDGFGLAVAGYGSLPFSQSQCVSGVTFDDIQISNVRVGIHVEYCDNVVFNNYTITSVNAALYPAGGESGGIDCYGCFDPVFGEGVVKDVTGDRIYAWGVQVRGGFSGATYAQSPRNPQFAKIRLRNASAIIEQQLLTSAYGGQPAYDLTTSSTLILDDVASDNGTVQVYATGTVLCRNLNLVAPLSYTGFVVTSYARNANVATLIVTLQNSSLGLAVGDTIKVYNVGAGFDTQFATITSVNNATGAITYANVGANVGTTAVTGSIALMAPALMMDCSDTITGNAAFNTPYRLVVAIENCRATNIYGQSSFSLRNVSTASRYAANVQLRGTGNNFPVQTAYLPAVVVNRAFYTTAAANPTGIEFVVGDELVNTVGGAATRQFCTGSGYVSPGATSYAIISATAGTIKRTAGTSWFSTTPPFSVGQLITVTNGGSSIVGLVQRIFLSGADEAIGLVDPALGTALDLTSVGGPGTLAPYTTATFGTF